MQEAALIEHADGRTFLRQGECDGCAREGVPAAQCCTFMTLPLARPLSEDETRWAELHPGVTIEGSLARISLTCSALVDGRCTLFGSPERPAICERYPEMPEQMSVLAGCAYTFTEVSA